MKKQLRAALAFLILIPSFVSANAVDVRHFDERQNPELDSLRNMWSTYNSEGMYDSVISVTRPYLNRWRMEGDTIAYVYSAISITQAFLFMENHDSLKVWIETLDNLKWDYRQEPLLYAALCNIKGIYALKTKLNYPEALRHYVEGYAYAESSMDTDNKISFLNNIVNIFYLLSDTTGTEYALEAYRISQSGHACDYAVCLAEISLSQMYYLSGKYEKAMEYVLSAQDRARASGIAPILPTSYLLLADIYAKKDVCEKADSCYNRAIEHISAAEPGMQTMIYLHYGRFLERQGFADKALEQFEIGLAISLCHDNVELRMELLRQLGDIGWKTGNYRDAANSYRQYFICRDSLEVDETEREFNVLLKSYMKMEHDYDIQEKEMALLKANKKSMTILLILLTVIACSALIVFMLYRQRKHYRVLVSRYREYIRRQDASESILKSVSKEDMTDSIGKLYLRIDELMNRDKIYRRKDVSLDVIASALGTNRTYISKAINTYAKMTFYNYIDMYRIKEATQLLVGNDAVRNIKGLSDFIGYKQVSIFYKAFKRETGCTPVQFSSGLGKDSLNVRKN